MICDEGYAADFFGQCVECKGVALTAFLFALTCLAAVIIVSVIVFVTVTEQEDDDNSLVLLLKICVNFVQTSGTIGLFSIDMPQPVKSFLGIQNSSVEWISIAIVQLLGAGTPITSTASCFKSSPLLFLLP